jgi:antitoxin component YwqK of YwqJK toxin-antitoxin module
MDTPEGVQREYYPSGQLIEEFFIKYNIAYGIMRNWDENGNLLDEYDWGPEPEG